MIAVLFRVTQVGFSMYIYINKTITGFSNIQLVQIML